MIEDRSFGIVPVFQINGENQFLIVKHVGGHWGFPKGHREGEETIQETALRELSEETGIMKCRILDLPPRHEEYIYEDRGEKYHKIVQYLIGLVSDPLVTLPNKHEISEYKWASYEEAMSILSYDNNKKVLEEAKKFL